MNSQQEEVLELVARRDVRMIRLWFSDVIGKLKSIAIDSAELENAFNEGVGFDGSAIEGMTRVYESDMLLRPDASTFQQLPWRDADKAVGRMFCDVHTPDDELSRSHPRSVLEREIQRAAELGFSMQVHPEIEFYLIRPPKSLNEPLVPVDQGGYFDHVSRGGTNDFRRRVVDTLEEMGISVEFSHHEGGPGQNEIDLRAVDALTGADNIMTFRTVVEELALQEGMMATFMPKPITDQPGSGMHTHLSLFEGDKNAFYDASGEYQLSQVGRQFIAGLLAHAGEMSAVINQHVNSYKRLWGGGEAPSFICWGHNNRSALVRVPLYKPDKPSAARVEYRALDPSANPYLAYAALLSAGLAGIKGKYQLAEEAQDDVWQLSDAERTAMGIAPLPSSLHQALNRLRDSELMAQTLGEEVFAYVLREKEHEWRSYRRQVTPKELARFLSVQ